MLNPLELVCPTGSAARIMVLGGGLGSAGPEQAGQGDLDLVVIAPTPEEAGTGPWLADAAAEAARRAGEGGIVYVLAPPRTRPRLLRHLAEEGFTAQTPFLHFSPAQPGRLFASLTPSAILFAARFLSEGAGWKRRVLVAAARVPGALRMAGRVLPMGIAARRPDAGEPFAWAAPSGFGSSALPVAVLSGRHGPLATAAVFSFAETGGPVSVLKLVRPTEPGPSEADRIAQLAAAARTAGARLPVVLDPVQTGAGAFMRETCVSGRPLALTLRERPEKVAHALSGVASFLGQWNRLTVTAATLDPTDFARRFVAPAAGLLADLPGGEAFRLHLLERLARLAGCPVPWVAAHNDLTMWNVLDDGSAGLGVVDWESARPDGLPLADFFYAAADAVAAVGSYADRPAAFAACFGQDGDQRPVLAPLERRLAELPAMTREWSDICFQVCWLAHATNEHRRGWEGPRPFRQILQLVVAGPPGVERKGGAARADIPNVTIARGETHVPQ